MVLVVISIISLAWLPNQLAGTQFCFRLRTEPGRVLIVSAVVTSLNHVGLLVQLFLLSQERRKDRSGQVLKDRSRSTGGKRILVQLCLSLRDGLDKSLWFSW